MKTNQLKPGVKDHVIYLGTLWKEFPFLAKKSSLIDRP